MFEKRSNLVRLLAVAESGRIGAAAGRLGMTQPALTRIIARLERRFGGRLFERLPVGVRLTPLGVTVTERARGILHEIEAAEATIDDARAGRTGRFRVTANPIWSATVLPEAIARFQDACPGIEVTFETTTRAEGLRLLADGESDLHSGGIDVAERLPEFLRRERFVDITAGIVTWCGHPLLATDVTLDDLAHCAWGDFREGPIVDPPDNGTPSLAALLDRLHLNDTHAGEDYRPHRPRTSHCRTAPPSLGHPPRPRRRLPTRATCGRSTSGNGCARRQRKHAAKNCAWKT